MFLRPTGSQWRTPEIGKSVIVSSYRGITRVQAWPRPRGPAKTTDQKNRQLIFKSWQQLVKRMNPREFEYERAAIEQYNRTHRGQRGSAAIRLRDWITQRLYGRGIAIDAPDGITYYPPAVRRDASFLLDHTTAKPGQLLQRTAQQWGAIPQGQPAQLLTSNGPGNANAWQTI